MTDDQQFILALATLIVPTIATILTYRKTSATHEAVNGVQRRLVRRARSQGVAAGVRASGARAGTMGEAGKHGTAVPLQRPADGS